MRNQDRIPILPRFIMMCCTCMLLLMLCSGCEDDDDFDHDIPEGQGSLVINNTTYNDIYVYINGREYATTDADDYEFYDRSPGTYSLVLDERHGDRNWFGYVEILEGRKTILDVYTSVYINNYDVYSRLD